MTITGVHLSPVIITYSTTVYTGVQYLLSSLRLHPLLQIELLFLADPFLGFPFPPLLVEDLQPESFILRYRAPVHRELRRVEVQFENAV